MRNSRDIGLNHGAPGKGDKNRTTNERAYLDNFRHIAWNSEPLCFEKRGHKLVKTYGALPLFTGILR